MKSRNEYSEKVIKDKRKSVTKQFWPTFQKIILKSDYELFNRNSFNIRYWSWNYRGCWHQTCPPVAFVKGFNLYSFVLQIPVGPAYLFVVTTSACRQWVICAPAAFLGSGSRFSSSLSGIKPQFPVTHQLNGRPISYHRNIIGQKFEWCIATSKGYAIR